MPDYNFENNFTEGQIGERAVSVMLKALGVRHMATGAPGSQRDESGRALPDFKAVISRAGVNRKTFIEVKTESAFYYCPTRRH